MGEQPVTSRDFKRKRDLLEADTATTKTANKRGCYDGESTCTSEAPVLAAAGRKTPTLRGRCQSPLADDLSTDMVVAAGGAMRRPVDGLPLSKYWPSHDTWLLRQEEQRVMDIQRAMIADKDGDRPIHIAVIHEDILLVRKLCALMRSVGASIDIFNYLRQTPLHLAVIVNNPHMVEAMLEEGASLQLRDRHGDTPIHLAIKFRSHDCLRVLLHHRLCRMTFGARNYEGYTPLHLAIFKDDKLTIQLLVKAGCDIDIQDGKSGRTPLIHSILSKKWKMVQLLLRLGASVEMDDYSGVTAIEAANSVGNKELAMRLELQTRTTKY